MSNLDKNAMHNGMYNNNNIYIREIDTIIHKLQFAMKVARRRNVIFKVKQCGKRENSKSKKTDNTRFLNNFFRVITPLRGGGAVVIILHLLSVFQILVDVFLRRPQIVYSLSNLRKKLSGKMIFSSLLSMYGR